MTAQAPVIEKVGSVTIVTMGNMYDSLDGSTISVVMDPLISASQEAVPPTLLLDMSPTKFFGSSFIEVLVKMWNNLKSRGGNLHICGLQKYCLEVLEITHLDNVWPLYKTREEALKELGKK